MCDDEQPDRRARSRRVGQGVRVLSLETQAYVDHVARGAGHPRSDIMVVGALIAGTHEGTSLTPGALARRVNLSAAAVTALLDRLARTGLIRRRPHEHDGRRIVVETTDAARHMSSTRFAGLREAQERVLQGYSDVELDLAERVLADLAEASRQALRDETAQAADLRRDDAQRDWSASITGTR